MSISTLGETLERLHKASLQVLESTGVQFFHPKVLRIIQNRGVKVAGQTAYFSPQQVMEWIKKAPSSFAVHARNPEHDILLGGDKTEFAAGYGAPAIVDQFGHKRSATYTDYLAFLKMVHQCSFFHINGGILVQPNDIGTRQQFPLMLYAALVYSDKCLMSGAGGAEEANMALDILDIVFGKETLLTAPRILSILNSTSPLQFDRDNRLMIY